MKNRQSATTRGAPGPVSRTWEQTDDRHFPHRRSSRLSFPLPTLLARPAIQALGADSHSAAPRLPSAAAQTHRAEERHRRLLAGRPRAAVHLRLGAHSRRLARRRSLPKPDSSVSTAQAWRTSGTAKMDGDAMDDLLESKAAHIETAGDDDSTALSWDSLKGDSDQVFSLAMDLLFHPKFSAEKLQLAQQQEATGIVRRNDDEDGIAGRESAKLVYGVEQPLHAPAGVGHHRRSHVGRSSGLARPHAQGKADRRHLRRLRSRGHGSQSPRGL